MGQKIIIPTYQLPPLSSFSTIYDQVESITKTLQNSYITQAAETAAREIRRMDEMYEKSGFAEMHRKQQELADSISRMSAPLFEAMQKLTDSLPTYVFQPIIHTTPKQNFQKPNIDLPSVVISGKKAGLHFNGKIIELGNAKTQVAKAAQYLCDNIGNEVDLAMLYTYCKDPERGKRSSLVKSISMDDRYKRGAATISDLYKVGIREVFYLDGYWQSGKRKFIPVLKK